MKISFLDRATLCPSTVLRAPAFAHELSVHERTAPAEVAVRIADADIVIGSRYLASNSLPGWAISRRVLTLTGHFVTRTLLAMPYDATGALRLYRLRPE